MDDYGLADRQHAGQSVSPAEERRQRVAGEARRESHAVMEDLQHYMQNIARDGKDRVADRLHAVCESIHRAATILEQEQHQTSGGVAHRAADGLDDLAEYLHQHEPSDLVEDATQFAKRQPVMFVGGALVAGLLLGRFLRSGQGREGYSEDPMHRSETAGQRAEQPGPPREAAQPQAVGAGAEAETQVHHGRGAPAEGAGQPGRAAGFTQSGLYGENAGGGD